MSLQEKQANAIKTCREIYDHYSKEDEVDWNGLIERVEPYFEEKFCNDPDIKKFARWRFVDMYRELQVVKGGEEWPIKKD